MKIETESTRRKEMRDPYNATDMFGNQHSENIRSLHICCEGRKSLDKRRFILIQELNDAIIVPQEVCEGTLQGMP